MEARLPNPLSFEGNVAENFKRFKQSFEIYLMPSGKSGKSDEVKVAILLNLIGEEGIEIYNSLELTEVQQGKLADVLEAFESYVTPRKNVVYERYLFYKRIQEEGEPFDHFLTDLKNKVRNCEFGVEAFSMVRDRIVLGTNSKDAQQSMLKTINLDLTKAIEICKMHEVSQAQIKEVQNSLEKVKIESIGSKVKQGHNSVQTVRGASSSRGEFNCRNCGSVHGPRRCPAYGKKCRKCGKYGHFDKVCYHGRLVREVQVEES
ncbi:uncharacterized protein [Diabrotica undecimpunctata]|uniref:uncharacterized protein n=1 Tax=Diabrotica undecimpunctata TaxID=50387 RepID=UPI003B632BE8